MKRRRTKKYSLWVYQHTSRRLRGILLLLVVTTVGFGLYDQFYPVLGDRWYYWWFAVVILIFLWFYYAVLLRRAKLHIRDTHLRVQGPLRGLNVSYDHVHSITSATISQHYGSGALRGHERRIVEKVKHNPAVFVELTKLPRGFRWRRWWLPRLLFGTSRPGLLLFTDDWIALSQDLEGARGRWSERQAVARRGDRRSAAARVLAEPFSGD